MTQPSAFTGYEPHAVPLRDIQHFRTPRYSKWALLCKQQPAETPSWEVFRDARSKPSKAKEL